MQKRHHNSTIQKYSWVKAQKLYWAHAWNRQEVKDHPFWGRGKKKKEREKNRNAALGNNSSKQPSSGLPHLSCHQLGSSALGHAASPGASKCDALIATARITLLFICKAWSTGLTKQHPSPVAPACSAPALKNINEDAGALLVSLIQLLWRCRFLEVSSMGDGHLLST